MPRARSSGLPPLARKWPSRTSISAALVSFGGLAIALSAHMDRAGRIALHRAAAVEQHRQDPHRVGMAELGRLAQPLLGLGAMTPRSRVVGYVAFAAERHAQNCGSSFRRSQPLWASFQACAACALCQPST